MIVEATTLPFLRKGKRTTVTFPVRGRCPYRVGESYVLQVRHPRVEPEDDTPPTPARIVSTESRLRVLQAERDDARGVWRVTVELDRQQAPRWMHKRSEKGYTSSRFDALPDELEAVDDRALERFAADARERHDAFLAEQETRTLAERVAELERLQAAGLDVRHQFMAIERRVRAAERKAAQRAA